MDRYVGARCGYLEALEQAQGMVVGMLIRLRLRAGIVGYWQSSPVRGPTWCSNSLGYWSKKEDERNAQGREADGGSRTGMKRQSWTEVELVRNIIGVQSP